MNRERLYSVFDRGERRVQGIDADVQCALAAVAAPLRKDELAAARYFLKRL
jgi:hypothetical protein